MITSSTSTTSEGPPITAVQNKGDLASSSAFTLPLTEDFDASAVHDYIASFPELPALTGRTDEEPAQASMA